MIRRLVLHQETHRRFTRLLLPIVTSAVRSEPVTCTMVANVKSTVTEAARKRSCKPAVETKKNPSKRSSAESDQTVGVAAANSSSILPLSAADRVANAARSHPTTPDANGNVKSNVAESARKRTCKPAVEAKEVPGQPDDDSLTVPATKENSPISDIPVNFDTEIAMCDEILESLPDETLPT